MSRALAELPGLIFEISRDIEVTDKRICFALSIGLTLEELNVIIMNPGRYQTPTYAIMMRWMRKSPKVNDLAELMCKFGLERSLLRLQPYVSKVNFQNWLKRIHQKRQPATIDETNLLFNKDESENIECSNECITPRLLSEEPNSNIITDEPHLPLSIISDLSQRSYKPSSPDNNCEMSLFKDILNQESISFLVKEFDSNDIIDNGERKQFPAYFHKKLRGVMFTVQSYSLEKISASIKRQKELYNTIWSLRSFKLYSLPILTGYCFFEKHLFLIYPDHSWKSLFDVLHRSYNINDIISAQRRLTILRVIGETLGFLHSFEPFPGNSRIFFIILYHANLSHSSYENIKIL